MADNARPVILLTRAAAQSRRFAQDIAAACPSCTVAIHPMQEIVFTQEALDLSDVSVLAFGSENGVRAFAARSDRRDLVAYCVGPRTASVAREIGLRAICADGAIDDLLALLVANRPAGVVLYVHGQHRAGDLVAGLAAQGIRARAVIAYRQEAIAPAPAMADLIRAARPVIWPQFSPRAATMTAQALSEIAPNRAPDTLRLPCISAQARAALPQYLWSLTAISAHPNGDAMRDLVLEFAKSAPWLVTGAGLD